MASNLRHSSESRRNHVENQMGLESSEEGIGSNIATKIKKENLLLANYSGFPRWGIFLTPHIKADAPHMVPPS